MTQGGGKEGAAAVGSRWAVAAVLEVVVDKANLINYQTTGEKLNFN